MNQDTAHYYLVTFDTMIVGRDTRMIFRAFKEIENYLQSGNNKATIELVPCADFDKQGKSFDDWKGAQEGNKGPAIVKTMTELPKPPSLAESLAEALKKAEKES